MGSSFALEDQAKVFRVTLAKPLKKGERVHVSLGAKPNSQLLANYGFVLRDNPYDTVLLSMQLDEKVSGMMMMMMMMMMMPAPRISTLPRPTPPKRRPTPFRPLRRSHAHPTPSFHRRGVVCVCV